MSGIHSITCPSCRKTREVAVSPAVTCRRCECDLSSLVQIKDLSSVLQNQALQRLREGEPKQAMDLAETAWSIERTRETAAIGFLAAVRLGLVPQNDLWTLRRRSNFQ